MHSSSLIQARIDKGAPRPELQIEETASGWEARWGTSHLTVRRPAELAARDGVLCISRGRPRFEDGTGLASGHAQAWLSRYLAQGADVIHQARGRFAVAFVHVTDSQAQLLNDRFDTEAWFHAGEGSALLFSDRADGVPVQHRRINPQAIFDYLYFHAIPSPICIFEGVERLTPASRLDWKDGRRSLSRHWRPAFQEHSTLSLEQAKKRFMEIVRESVEREYCGPGTGAFLSGGTDSSTVSGMLCKITGQAAPTYSMGFDATGYDEMEYARIAARHFGTDHHEYYVKPDDLIEGIPLVARHYDQPFGNSSAVPAWICARQARADGIGTLLAGDGGDELFGGNTRYAKQRVFGWYETLPSLLRSTVVEPLTTLPGMNRIPLVRKGVSYVEQASIPLPDRTEIYNLIIRLGLDKVFTPAFLAGINRQEPNHLQRATWNEVPDASLVNRMLAFDWKYTLADNDLPKVVGTTRLAGVDVGFPLISDELLDFSLALPTEWKLKGLKLRWLFKEALRGFLPDEIITKQKHGFGLPFGVWSVKHPALGKLATDSLESFGSRGVIPPAFLKELHTKWLPEHPGYYGEMVWIVMMLEQWLQAYAPDWRFEGR
ncbi:asparagine synthase-related protein [Zoogloea sp.]|uniref:asparagine synthetase B family protein n=1 Tax=Zoogloea sp. TaxID=49181 RepID=UPI0026139984|nr:asparagine synthase-related protein [Zoogloea sp.]MDD3355252.1 asparagine synthase-related protein [Zoogloea sp.]